MKCVICGVGNLKSRIGSFRDRMLGLPYVTLVGVEFRKCQNCGDESVRIPRLAQLNRFLAAHIITKPGRMSGHEIRFLRSYMGWDLGELAKHLGIQQATVSSWEKNEESINPTADRLLRMTAQYKSPLAGYDLEDLIHGVKMKSSKSRPLRLIHKRREWKLAV